MAKPLNNLPLRRSARLQQRQCSCLRGLQSTLVEEKSDIDRGGPNVDPDLWCSCQGRDDGRLMICCDRQGENCYVWYHYDCVGLTLEEGRRIGASGKDFVCPSCRLIPDDSPDSLFIVDTPHLLTPCTDFQWGTLVDKHCVTLYYLHTRKLFIGGLMFFWFHLGRLESVLCLNLLDCIKPL